MPDPAPPIEAPLPNDPASRTPTGEIRDVRDPSPTPTPTPNPTPSTPEPPVGSSTTTPEAKPDAKPTDPKPAETLLNKPPEGAPETYAEFKAPEGYEIDKEVLDQAIPIFKKLNISQEGAQELFDLYAKRSIEQAEAPTKAYNDLRTDWQSQVKADKEIGHIIPQVKLEISRALDSIGDPALVAEFKSAMDLTGAGDHPAFVKAFYKLAKSVNEGTHVTGGGPSPHGQSKTGQSARPTPAQALYPHLAQR